jgi:4-hydroxymandelate oxidase
MHYICTYCNIYIFDSERGDAVTAIPPGIVPDGFPDEWRCPVCGMPSSYMQEIAETEFQEKKEVYEAQYKAKYLAGRLKPMKARAPRPVQAEQKPVVKDLVYYRDLARERLTGVCGVYNVCDGGPGRICYGQKFGRPLGWGGAGQGKTFERNYLALQEWKLKERIVKAHAEPDMRARLFGVEISAPVMSASLAGVKKNMNNIMPEEEFYRGLVDGAKAFGTIGMAGDTVDEADNLNVKAVAGAGGWGIPVFKPHGQERLIDLFHQAEEAKAIAVGVDLDGCGSLNFAQMGRPVYRKSPEELKELVRSTKEPVIFKGIMSMEDAEAVYASGAAAIYVSNHGGRVLDSGLGVADVLPDISERFKGKTVIMADGAVRTGFDVLKMVALGADVALIGRNLARMSLAGGAAAVRMYLDYVKSDLRLAMIMTGCDSLKEVSSDILVHMTGSDPHLHSLSGL